MSLGTSLSDLKRSEEELRQAQLQQSKNRKDSKKASKNRVVKKQTSIVDNMQRLHAAISRSRSRAPESYKKISPDHQSLDRKSEACQSNPENPKSIEKITDKASEEVVNHRQNLNKISKRVAHSFKRPERVVKSIPKKDASNRISQSKMKKEKMSSKASETQGATSTPGHTSESGPYGTAKEKKEAREMQPLFDQVREEMRNRARSVSVGIGQNRVNLPPRFKDVHFPEFLDYGPLPQKKLGRKSKADKIIDRRAKEKEVIGFSAGDFDTMTDYEILAGIKTRKFEQLQDQQKKGGFTFETAINALLTSLIYKLRPLNGDYSCYCGKPSCQKSYTTVVST